MMNGGTVKGKTGGKMKTVCLKLWRDGPRTPWGFRIIGGVDLGAPIQVQRVQVGSPVDGTLKRGDLISKIGDYDARDLAHKEAQNLFKTASNEMSVVVQRSSTASYQSYQQSSSSMTSTTQAIGPPTMGKSPVAGGVATPFAAAGATLPRTPSAPPASGLHVPSPGPGYVRSGTPGRAASPMPSSMSEALRSPVESLPHTMFPVSGGMMPSQGPPPRAPSPFPFVQPPPVTDPELEVVTNQPYRTTPLVLPGAKTKKDVAPTTSSYLRHHPNPMFRNPPSAYDQDALMRQKVAGTVIEKVAGQEMNGSKIVHKQFNSPINLYSEQNIADTITAQTQLTPKVARVQFQNSSQPLSPPTKMSPKPPPVFDPSKSEAYKALKEEELGISEPAIAVVQEVNPVQTKVFQPGAAPPAKSRPPPPKQAPKQLHHSHPQPHMVAPSARVNSLGAENEKIAQSHSFKRIMQEVLGESEY